MNAYLEYVRLAFCNRHFRDMGFSLRHTNCNSQKTLTALWLPTTAVWTCASYGLWLLICGLWQHDTGSRFLQEEFLFALSDLQITLCGVNFLRLAEARLAVCDLQFYRLDLRIRKHRLDIRVL